MPQPAVGQAHEDPTMSIRSLVAPFFFASLSLAVGCAAAHDTSSLDEEVGPEQSSASDAVSKKLPSPAVATQRLYFPNSTSALPYLGGAVAWPYPAAGETKVTSHWVFSAKGGTSFDVSLAAYDDGDGIPDAKLSLTVYYLYDGKWTRWHSKTGKGSIALTLSPAYPHQYLITATGDVGSDSNNLEIRLGCDSGVDAAGHSLCALAQEPGDACGGIAASAFSCDDQLFCDFGASCGKGDVQGKCAQLPNKSCVDPKTGTPTGTPVCGCDGKTYANECTAHTAAMSIASDGACGTPPSCDWSGSVFTTTYLTSTLWKTADLKNWYLFNGDGTFQSVYDRCAAPPGTIHCMIAAQTKNGRWSNKGANLVLAYDDGTSAMLTEQQDCKGNGRLDGTDWSIQIDALDAGPR